MLKVKVACTLLTPTGAAIKGMIVVLRFGVACRTAPSRGRWHDYDWASDGGLTLLTAAGGVLQGVVAVLVRAAVLSLIAQLRL